MRRFSVQQSQRQAESFCTRRRKGLDAATHPLCQCSSKYLQLWKQSRRGDAPSVSLQLKIFATLKAVSTRRRTLCVIPLFYIFTEHALREKRSLETVAQESACGETPGGRHIIRPRSEQRQLPFYNSATEMYIANESPRLSDKYSRE